MVICIDLGATNVKVALFDEKNDLIKGVEQIPTNADCGKDGVLRALKQATELYLSPSVGRIAVSSAGTIDSEAKKIVYATDNLPGMTGFDYGAFFADNYGLPVSVANDAHAALLGEINFGAAKSRLSERVIMITLGSGVGGAYAVNGKIVASEQNDYARFGHICLHLDGNACTCGKSGCAETYLSGRAIHRDLANAGLGDDVFRQYLCGDRAAKRFVDGFKSDFKLLLDKIQIVCPFDACVVGGGVADWMDCAFGPIFGDISEQIVKAELGNAAGVYGALTLK